MFVIGRRNIIVICTMQNAICAMRTAICTMHTARCAMHTARCAMHYTLHTLHYALCTLQYAYIHYAFTDLSQCETEHNIRLVHISVVEFFVVIVAYV